MMPMDIQTYKPRGKNKEILDRAMEHIESVPYKVSLRWSFYRLLQDGHYGHKEDYKAQWTPICSRARKCFYDGWRPDTLSDDTRSRILRVGFYMDEEDFKKKLIDHVVNNIEVTFDHFYEQDEFTIIAFEAKAMTQQFLHYTKEIDLLPFGGEVSVPFKWEIAKHFENCYKWYQKPLRLLYFGDYDKKGREIFESAMKDISRWCRHEILPEWCGLTREQAEKFQLPENPEKPGQYQWEALTDPQAKEIIFTALAAFGVDTKLIEAKIKEGERVTKEWRKKIRKAITPLTEDGGKKK